MFRITHITLPMVLSIVLVTGFASLAQPDIKPASADEPVYKVLYESGYYAQALEYIESRLAAVEDSLLSDYQRYQAYCLILVGRRPEAQEVFATLLERDSSFTLDPIRTSPKIYEVYHAAKNRRKHSGIDSVTALEESGTKDTGRVDTVLRATLPGDSTGLPAAAVPMEVADGGGAYRARVPLYLMPFGVGQFVNQQPVKGWTVLATQTLCLTASIVSYVMRDSYYDSRYGWYEGNRKQYDDFTLAFRIDFAGFGLAYVYGIVDALVVGRRRRGGRVPTGDAIEIEKDTDR